MKAKNGPFLYHTLAKSVHNSNFYLYKNQFNWLKGLTNLAAVPASSKLRPDVYKCKRFLNMYY